MQSPSRRVTPESGTAFDRLLLALDPDRDRAGERYELLRRKLIRLFAWRGCRDAEGCADETLDRASRRLSEGAPVPDVARFCHGVALNVLREHWRQRDLQAASLDELPPAREPSLDPAVEAREREEGGRREARLRCLDACLARLGSEARSLLARYHDGPQPAAERRRDLARELGVPLNALRIRVHRVRSTLASCIEACQGRAESD